MLLLNLVDQRGHKSLKFLLRIMNLLLLSLQSWISAFFILFELQNQFEFFFEVLWSVGVNATPLGSLACLIPLCSTCRPVLLFIVLFLVIFATILGLVVATSLVVIVIVVVVIIMIRKLHILNHLLLQQEWIDRRHHHIGSHLALTNIFLRLLLHLLLLLECGKHLRLGLCLCLHRCQLRSWLVSTRFITRLILLIARGCILDLLIRLLFTIIRFILRR